MITSLCFDLGNVLVRWDPRNHYRDRFDTQESMEAFLAEVCPPAWNHEMDLGKPFADAIAERQVLFPEHHALIGEWRSGWERMLGGAIDEMVARLPGWRQAGYQLVALSNWSAETFPVACRRFPWLETQFDVRMISGELGMAKPDEAIFRETLARAGRRPEQVVFIDDSLTNTAAAARLGLATITFTSAAQCLRELAELGVADPAEG